MFENCLRSNYGVAEADEVRVFAVTVDADGDEVVPVLRERDSAVREFLDEHGSALTVAARFELEVAVAVLSGDAASAEALHLSLHRLAGTEGEGVVLREAPATRKTNN